MQGLRGGDQDPFRPGHLSPYSDTDFFEVFELKDFANIYYKFMTGIPFRGSAGFSMMGPDEVRAQRWTFVKFWLGRLDRDVKEFVTAAKSAPGF